MINKFLGVRNAKKIYKKYFNNSLIKRFVNIYEFCDGDINKFILLLRKVFMHANICRARKDLMKRHCLTRNNFTVV